MAANLNVSGALVPCRCTATDFKMQPQLSITQADSTCIALTGQTRHPDLRCAQSVTHRTVHHAFNGTLYLAFNGTLLRACTGALRLTCTRVYTHLPLALASATEQQAPWVPPRQQH